MLTCLVRDCKMNTNKNAPWQWRGYPSDTNAASFGQLSSFVDLWHSKSPQPGVFPAWRDFDIMDFEGWWGQVSLAKIMNDPFDVKWILWGAKITYWWGIDYTNMRMSETSLIQDVWLNYERGYFQNLMNDRLIGYVSGTLAPQSRNYIFIRGVDLPLEANGKITHYLTAYQKCTPDDTGAPEIDPIFII